MSEGTLVLGTAGHIDHGKTWLARALTGVDTDRLPEERRRGISIALGYAPLELDHGLRLSLIDVPGHERFVRTMVAGATGIDLFLLVVDAREGPRPQTDEHLAILRLLGVEHGVVAVTKADAVDAETLELAVELAGELVPEAEVVPVSAATGEGLDELRAALARVARTHERVQRFAATRLFLDRVFTLHGIGTVATGTLWSGVVEAGAELELVPRGALVRVRSVQVHGSDVERAGPGQRVAVALGAERHQRPARGDALIAPGAYPVSYRVDVALQELRPIADGARLTVHHGTRSSPARVVRAGGRFAQLRLARPLVAARGDRVILRAGTTVGAGLVLDPAPPRQLDGERLELLASGDAAAILRALLEQGPATLPTLAGRAVLDERELAAAASQVARVGEWLYAPEWLERARERARMLLAEPDANESGLTPAQILGDAPWAQALAGELGLERREGRLHLPGSVSRPLDDPRVAELEAALSRSGFEPVRVEDRRLLGRLEREQRLVRVGDGLAVSTGAYAEARALLVEECERAGTISLARFRDLLGVSRRVAQLLLERLDEDRVTLRVGDERRLRSQPTRR